MSGKQDELADKLRKKSTRKVNFDTLADELSERLEKVDREDAKALAAEGRALAERFRSWESTPPAPQERGDTIDAIARFNQRALELLKGA